MLTDLTVTPVRGNIAQIIVPIEVDLLRGGESNLIAEQNYIKMDTCANCDASFKEREKGYHRFSLEKIIPATGNTARCHLEQMFSIPVTPRSKKTDTKFLCSVCWNGLNNAVKYKKAVTEFWGSTESSSYVGSKRLLTDLASPGTSKRPRFTSTPLKVRP